MTLSITRALAEIKSLDDRIQKTIASSGFIAIVKGEGSKRTVHNTGLSVDKVEADINASFNSVNDLLARRSKLKAAIIKSNGETVVTIGDKSMTVAEAIERKNSIAHEKLYLEHLRSQFGTSSRAVATLNQQLDDQIEKAVIAAYGSDKSKINEGMYDSIANPRRADHKASLLDPQNIASKIDELNISITAFELEVDFVLSESNARTAIDV